MILNYCYILPCVANNVYKSIENVQKDVKIANIEYLRVDHSINQLNKF